MYGLFQFGRTAFKNGRVSPYTVRLPDSRPPLLFQLLAEAAWSSGHLDHYSATHLIGIANSGTPLAQAIYDHGKRLGREVQLTIVSPTQSECIASVTEPYVPMLIDNAITTGKSIEEVKRLFSPRIPQPKQALRIFDREDLGDDNLSTAERVILEHDVDVQSIFRLRDLLPLLQQHEREAILAYQYQYATPSFRFWMEEQGYVF